MKLPVADILLDAFRIPWHNRKDFARVLLIPLTGIVVVDFVQYYWIAEVEFARPLISTLFLLLNAVLFSWLAVCCHRLVLLGIEGESGDRKWTRRETHFLLVLTGLYISATLITWLGGMFSSLVLPALLGGWFLAFVYIFAWYLFARVSLILPAIALDHPFNLVRAWRQSAGSGLRLFVIVCILPWALSSSLWSLYPSGDDVPVLSALIQGLTTLLLVCEISALSLCYRFLAHK